MTANAAVIDPDIRKAAGYQVLRWRSDPVAFVREALRVEPQEWQAIVLMSLVKHDKIAIRSGHGVGKSSLMSWIILWWLATRYPAKVACTAPTAHQLYDVLWSELARWSRQLPDQVKDNFEWKSERYEVKGAGNESFAVARTARLEQPEALQGFHSPNMLFLVDEASGVPDIIFEVGEGSLSTAGAKVVLAGNPTRTSGYFFDAFHRSRAQWTRFKVSCLDSPMVAPAFISSMKEKYGEDSNVFAIRVKGDFPRSEDDVVIPLNLLEDACARLIEPAQGYKPIWGVDVARYGDDRSALAKRHMNRLLEPTKSWSQLDTMQLAGTIIAEYQDTPVEMRPGQIMVDVIGIGSGVVDRLKEERMPVRGINVAESASAKPRFARLRDELWWNAREWFMTRGVWIPDDSDLIAELSSVKYALLGSGKLKVESKDEMKRRGLRSPDVADAFILTFAGRAEITPDRQEQRLREVRMKLKRRTTWMAG